MAKRLFPDYIENDLDVEIHFKSVPSKGKTILLREIKDFLLDSGLQVTSDENKHILYVKK